MDIQTQNAIDYDKMVIEFEGYADQMVHQFEETFDSRMQIMLQKMIEKDQSTVIFDAGTLKGSASYLFAYPFQKACKNFRTATLEYATRIKYDSNNKDVNRTEYQFNEMFDDNKKLIAYELFIILMKEAIRLKIAMSKVTKSIVPTNIYQKEMLQIQAVGAEIKKNNQSLNQLSENKAADMQLLIEPPQQNVNCSLGCDIF